MKLVPKFIVSSFSQGDWYHLDECRSTQLLFKNILEHGRLEQDHTQIFAISCNMQTSGIGRGQHTWDHQEGGVALSVLLPHLNIPTLGPLHMANMICDFIKETFQKDYLNIGLKWPNDLYRAEKKFGGIVAHNLGHQCLYGIGINLFQKSNFGFLFINEDTVLNAKNFIQNLLKYLSLNWENEQFSQEKWLNRCVHFNKKVRLTYQNCNDVIGVFTGLGKNGECLIDDTPYVAGSLFI